MFHILVHYLNFIGSNIIYILLVLIGAFEEAQGALLGFSILISVVIWKLFSEPPMFHILAVTIHSESARNIHAF